jgi:hypothetical protein
VGALASRRPARAPWRHARGRTRVRRWCLSRESAR